MMATITANICTISCSLSYTNGDHNIKKVPLLPKPEETHFKADEFTQVHILCSHFQCIRKASSDACT